MQIEQLGPYKIGRKLGRGGMGTVYEGVFVETGEPAAVKILSAALAHDEGFRERFKAEIETLRKLRHPNIVRLYGFGEQDDYLFYAMELVNGRSLEDELAAGRRFNWREVTDFAIQTCRALKHAHDRGVIHRDIKPANLLLTPEGEIKLSDFGIAKLFGSTGLTAVGGVLGTAEYMAPEQSDGRSITPRCDLYSLGGVLYTLLAGRPPFQAATLVEMLQLQRFAEPDPVGRYAPDVPQELQQIIADLLVKDPEGRIATAMVLSRRLEAMRHGLSMRGGGGLPVAPTQLSDVPPEVSVSSGAMTAAAAQPVEPAPPGDVLPKPPAEYELAPLNSSGDRPSATRDDGSLPATADLVSATTSDKEQKLPPHAPPAEPAGRFVAVAEDEHRRHEPDFETSTHRVVWQTVLLAAAVLMLAAGTWYLLQPATADALYGRIARAAGGGDINSLQKAQDDITAFLANYPDDPRAKVVREYQDDIDIYWAGRRAELRAQSTAGIESATPLERAYLEAINYARLNPERAAERLTALVDLYATDGQLSAADRESLKLARLQLERLRSQIRENVVADTRLLGARLDAADQLEKTDVAAARAIREAVVKLYGDKSWAATIVERAQAALAERTAAEPPRSP
ncbi:MAG: protein kinase [Planctomycetia bacterium]|nr:protein kinase [Planctomycetia bacterium]